MDDATRNLIHVARALQRSDVDVVVDVATYAAFARFEIQLRAAGHNPARNIHW